MAKLRLDIKNDLNEIYTAKGSPIIGEQPNMGLGDIIDSLQNSQNGDIASDGSVPFAANQSMGGFKLTNVGNPAANSDGANKAYVDSHITLPAGLNSQVQINDGGALGADASFSYNKILKRLQLSNTILPPPFDGPTINTRLNITDTTGSDVQLSMFSGTSGLSVYLNGSNNSSPNIAFIGSNVPGQDLIYMSDFGRSSAKSGADGSWTFGAIDGSSQLTGPDTFVINGHSYFSPQNYLFRIVDLDSAGDVLTVPTAGGDPHLQMNTRIDMQGNDIVNLRGFDAANLDDVLNATWHDASPDFPGGTVSVLGTPSSGKPLVVSSNDVSDYTSDSDPLYGQTGSVTTSHHATNTFRPFFGFDYNDQKNPGVVRYKSNKLVAATDWYSTRQAYGMISLTRQPNPTFPGPTSTFENLVIDTNNSSVWPGFFILTMQFYDPNLYTPVNPPFGNWQANGFSAILCPIGSTVVQTTQNIVAAWQYVQSVTSGTLPNLMNFSLVPGGNGQNIRIEAGSALIGEAGNSLGCHIYNTQGYNPPFAHPNGAWSNSSFPVANSIRLTSGVNVTPSTQTSVLEVFDATHQTNPQLFSTLSATPGTTGIIDLQVSDDGTKAFAISGTEILILDITTPSSPTSIWTNTPGGTLDQISVQGNRMVITQVGVNQPALVYDITTPSSPTLLDSTAILPPAGFDFNRGKSSLSISGTTLFIYAWDGSGTPVIQVWDISGGTPSLLSSYSTNLTDVSSLISSGTNLYVADRGGNFYVIDASNTSALSQSGFVNFGANNINDLTVEGSKVVGLLTSVQTVADYNTTTGTFLMVFDVSIPSSPTVTQYQTDVGIDGIRMTANPRIAFISRNRALVPFGYPYTNPGIELINFDNVGPDGSTGDRWVYTGRITDPFATGKTGDMHIGTGTNAGSGSRGKVVFEADHVDGNNLSFKNLANPANNQDASTKIYVDNKVLAFPSNAGGGGTPTEVMTVTGLLATDTIISVTQSTPGANSLPLLGWSTQANNALTGIWSADPGAGSVILVAVKR